MHIIKVLIFISVFTSYEPSKLTYHFFCFQVSTSLLNIYIIVVIINLDVIFHPH